MNILDLSTCQLALALREKKISCEEAASFFLDRISKLNPALNAVIRVNERLLEKARALDKKGSFEKPLAGVPILFKDMFCTKNIPTTAGSKMLKDFTPPYSAHVVEKLEQAGALILGKANQDEFAMGNSNETSFFGPCRNPWNLKLSPGGSSGGSAAAAAAGLCPAALGTDTGGSVRQPSHLCGIVGVKPTYGRVSRWGIVAYGSSLDQAGPMAKRVKDCALLLHLMSGRDPKDSTSSSQANPPWHEKLNPDIKNFKVGWLQPEGLSAPVKESLSQTRKVLEKKGVQIEPVSIPLLSYAPSIYYLISTSEASSNLARYDGIRYGHRASKSENLLDFYCKTRGEGFGSEVKRRILMGTFCLSEGSFEDYFEKAGRARRLLFNEFQKLFSRVDVLISPVTARPAPKLGAEKMGHIDYYMSDSLTVASNLTGTPSLSIPVGLFEGMPLGVQVMGPAFGEQKIFDMAYFLEKEFQFYKEKIPPLEERVNERI